MLNVGVLVGHWEHMYIKREGRVAGRVLSGFYTRVSDSSCLPLSITVHCRGPESHARFGEYGPQTALEAISRVICLCLCTIFYPIVFRIENIAAGRWRVSLFFRGGVKFGCPESISGMGHTHIALSLFGRMPTHGGHALHVAVNVKRHRAVSIRRVYSVCTRLAHKIRQTILIYMP